MSQRQKFDSFVGKYLSESPITAPPPRPSTKPSTKPSTPKPSTPNPDPFRRHEPGQMPAIKPKAQGKSAAAAELKQQIKGIISKHAKFLRA